MDTPKPNNIALFETDWNEYDIRSRIYNTICISDAAGELTLAQAKKLSFNIAQTIITRLNECAQLAEIQLRKEN